jgi:hypothetical protein
MIRSPQSQRQEEEIAQHHLLPELSPFQNGRRHRTADVRKTVIPGIGFVSSVSEEKDADGVPLRFTDHLVGIGCRHWAPSARETGDCRFGCLGRAA